MRHFHASSSSRCAGLSLPAPTLFQSPGWAALGSSVQEWTVTHKATVAPAAATHTDALSVPWQKCPEPGAVLGHRTMARSAEPAAPGSGRGAGAQGSRRFTCAGRGRQGSRGYVSKFPAGMCRMYTQGVPGRPGDGGQGRSSQPMGKRFPGKRRSQNAARVLCSSGSVCPRTQRHKSHQIQAWTARWTI